MQMRHGEDDYRSFIHSEDQAERKASQQAAAYSRLDLRAGLRESRGSPYGPVKFIEKFPTEPLSLFIVPSDRVIELLPGHGKKTNSHGRRCLVMTVS
jgi:hypothetical protein